MTTPGKLTVGADGRITGPASITCNDPFPVVNGTPDGGDSQMMGVVMHTMVGNLPSADAWFNDPASQVSAFFGIAQDGSIKQWGPVGQNWMAWAEAAGNPAWYSIEHADNGDPGNPLTAEQIAASAQLVECLSAYAGFPLQVTDSVGTPGYGVHYMGGEAWGGHSCPQLANGTGPRAGQRYDIIALAKLIRAGTPAPPPDEQVEGIVVVLPGGSSRKVLSADSGRTWS
jgi:hypothetical protein